MICNNKQVCNCDGVCECLPGLSGSECQFKSDCSKLPDCESCVGDENCGWCDGANVCENKYELNFCSQSDHQKNPRGFTIVTEKEQCSTAAIGDKDLLSEDKTQILVAAIIGSLGAAALALLMMAYFLRGSIQGPFDAGADLGPIGADAFQESGIHVGAATGGTSAVYV